MMLIHQVIEDNQQQVQQVTHQEERCGVEWVFTRPTKRCHSACNLYEILGMPPCAELKGTISQRDYILSLDPWNRMSGRSSVLRRRLSICVER